MIKSGTKRIIIADDEPAIRMLCRSILTEEGLEVDSAAAGRIALDMISKQKYAAYLIDVKMPIMDGKALYESLLKAYPGSASRTVFMTGSAISQETDGFLQRSDRPILQKPFTAEELRIIIREVLKAVNK